jgi:hypothetical protein
MNGAGGAAAEPVSEAREIIPSAGASVEASKPTGWLEDCAGNLENVLPENHPARTPKPKAEQKVYDSPQQAHGAIIDGLIAGTTGDRCLLTHGQEATKSKAIDLGSLSVAWREVEAHAAAGNKQRLKGALQHLLNECSTALARMRR